VLEIGAGVRYFTKLMRGWGYTVTDTDLVVDNTLDITSERRGDFDNVVAIGVMHHIIDHGKFLAGLANIKAMAQKRIILTVKLPSLRDAKKTRHSFRYSVLDYIEVLGNPVTVTACGYLSLLEWGVTPDERVFVSSVLRPIDRSFAWLLRSVRLLFGNRLHTTGDQRHPRPLSQPSTT